MMIQLNKISYFGKLRRKRDFIRSAGLGSDIYAFWDSWFNKCTRKNSFLPFLENKVNHDKSVWLFITYENDVIKIGLTIMSQDMAEREYPFLLFNEFSLLDSINSKDLLKSLIFYSQRLDKFKKIVSIGDLNDTNLKVFKSDMNNNLINSDLEAIFNLCAQQFIKDIKQESVLSYWINFNSGLHIKHLGTFTCTLYNKIYG